MTMSLFDDLVGQLPPADGAELVITVHGEPQSQGSKTGFATFRTVNGQREYTGNVAMTDGKTAGARERHKSWRGLVSDAAAQVVGETGEPIMLGPVLYRATFTMKRPKAHYRSGRYAGILKPNAPLWHIAKPDKGKLDRAVEDSLKDAGVYRDDSQLCAGLAFKVYTSAPGCGPEWPDQLEIPGVVIRVQLLRGA